MEVTLRGVTSVRGRRRVLDVPALDIATGRITAILGPNGAGKSSLLRVVAGLDRPISGTVAIGGVSSTDRKRYRPLVAMSFQRQVFLAGSVRHNLELGLGLRGVAPSSREARILEVAGACGIVDLLPRDARRISGGEAQRSNLARALALRAPVTLLDEPFSGFDAPARARLTAELPRWLRAFATTVIMVTHDREEARLLADDVVVLLQGRVAAAGPVHEVLRRPPSPEVARFLGFLVLSSGGSLFAVAPDRLRPGSGLHSFAVHVVRVLPGEPSQVLGLVHGQPVTITWPEPSPLPAEGGQVSVCAAPSDLVTFPEGIREGSS